MNRILIIGAGGFIGGFIAEEAIKRSYETWVAVRESTSRKYLSDPGLHFLVLDYEDPEQIKSALSQALPKGEKWDRIIWNLGATKCANFMDFNKINYLYLKDFISVLTEIGMLPERFLFMSSLSALGPADDKNYTPINSLTIPMPNTRYGLSKIKAETFLETQSALNWTIFRPTGVYGPHEKDYLMMIKSIDSGFDFGVGFRKQMLTFIYVADLVNAMFLALDSPNTIKKKYIISEDRAYTQKEFRKIVAKRLGKKLIIPIKLPMWIVYIASFAAEKWGVAQMKPSTLNRDKFKIMRQRNWSCDISDAQNDFDFKPVWTLEKGIDATVEEYLKDKNKKAK